MVTVTLNGQIDRYTRAGTGTGRQGVGQPVALNGCQRMQAGTGGHRQAHWAKTLYTVVCVANL